MFEIMRDLKKSGIKPSNKELNESFAEQIHRGSEKAYKDFVIRNIPLAVSLTRKFIRRTPQYGYLTDDLLCEGIKSLIKCASEFKDRTFENPQGYVIRSIFNSFIDLARKEKRPSEEYLAEGGSFYADLIYALDLKSDLEVLAHPFPEIVHLRLARNTLAEIAKKLNCAIFTVQYRLKKLEELLEARYAD